MTRVRPPPARPHIEKARAMAASLTTAKQRQMYRHAAFVRSPSHAEVVVGRRAQRRWVERGEREGR